MRPALLLALLLTFAGPANAGTPEGKTEVAFFLGASFLEAESDVPGPIPLRPRFPCLPELPCPPIDFRQRTALEGSVLIGFRLGRYLSERAAVEAVFFVAPSHDLVSEFRVLCGPGVPCPLEPDIFPPFLPDRRDRRKVAAYHYDVNFGYDLLTGETRPFLSFGIGAVSVDTPGEVQTDFAMNVGAGVKMYFSERLGARLEFSDHVIVDHFLTGEAEHDLSLRGGLLFRLP